MLDLRDYHARQGRRYKTMHLVFAALAPLVIARQSGDFGTWLTRSSFALIAATFTVVALWTRRVWLDTLAAIVLVSMASLFMWIRLQGLAG